MTARGLVTNDLPSQLPASVGVGTAAVSGQTLSVIGATAGDGGTNNGSGSLLYLKQNTGWSPNQPWALYTNGFTYLSGFRVYGVGGSRNLYMVNAAAMDFATSANYPITFTVNDSGYGGTRVQTLTATGVGVNISAPAAQMHVVSSSASQPVILAQATSGQTAALLDTTNSTGGTHYFQVMPTGHLIAGGTAPTASAGAAAASVTVSGTATDCKGVLTVTTTASPTAGQTLTTVTFSAAYASAPVVVISPSSAGAVSAGAYVSAVSTTGFTITEANAGPASGTVAVSYLIVQ